MFHRSFLLLVGALFVLAACQTDKGGIEPPLAQLSPPAAPVAVLRDAGKPVTLKPGLLLGAWAGNEVVAAMGDEDRLKNQQGEKRAYTAPIGQKVTWNNPETGVSGTLVPVRDGYVASGAYCREFQQTIMIAGKQQQGYGKACQQPDGNWKTAL